MRTTDQGSVVSGAVVFSCRPRVVAASRWRGFAGSAAIV
jgi:hypothetical protein